MSGRVVLAITEQQRDLLLAIFQSRATSAMLYSRAFDGLQQKRLVDGSRWNSIELTRAGYALAETFLAIEASNASSEG